jgi:hypothetical protein
MSEDWKKIAEWSAINAELEKIWEPGFNLMLRRNQIEKEIPWLKGHGANPSGALGTRIEPPPKKDAEMKEVEPPPPKKIIDTRSEKEKKSKKARTQSEIEKLPIMAQPRGSETKILDQSQNFPDDPNKK